MAITRSSLRNSIFTTIKSILVAANLNSGNCRVTSAYNDKDAVYPVVVINPANISKDEFSFNRNNYNDNIVVILDIYATKISECDSILDEIDNLSSLKKINEVQFNAWDEATTFEPVNENKVHLRSVTLTYKLR